ncbi:MAG: pantoate--beta-alanine ligase [Pseudomonadota bacterium]
MPQKRLLVERSRASIVARSALYSQEKKTIGFVPTMGALHNGHLSLIRLARERCDVVFASVFVNPTQFAPGEDFSAYPRDEAADLAKLEAAGCDVAYCPDASEMYPQGSVTDVRVPGLSDVLDGVYRPHFFYGVTTVVARLFLHVRPDVAVFGEKDFQQLQIIRRMVRDLGFPVQIIGAPTVRDGDGLAQSSRNLYLSPDERRRAGALQAALHRARSRILAGTAIADALAEARRLLTSASFTQVDYVDAVASDTLQPLPDTRSDWPAETRILGAAWLGKTRLIDNLPLTPVAGP